MNRVDLPPWDQIPLFAAPQVTTYTNGLTSTLPGAIVAPPDPLRWLLAFTPDTSGGSAAFAPFPIVKDTFGNVAGSFMVSVQNGTGQPRGNQWFILTVDEYGPLVNCAWYGLAVGASSATPSVITMSRLPVAAGADSWQLGKTDTGPKPPPARISTAPGVNGKQGILDYWYRLIAKLGIR